MEIIQIKKNYQIGLPKEIWKQLGLREGDQLEVVVEGKKLILEKVTIDPLEDSFGSWTGEKEGNEYVKEIRQGWKNRLDGLGIG